MIKERIAGGLKNIVAARRESQRGSRDPQDNVMLLHQTTLTEDVLEKKNSKKLSKELYREEKEFGLGNDTYAMAFKAFNWDVAA